MKLRPSQVRLLIVLFLSFIVPSFVFVYFNQTSMATGVFFAFFIICLLCLGSTTKISIKKYKIIVILLALLAIVLQSSYFAVFEENIKPLYSILALTVIVFIAFLLQNKINKMGVEKASSTVILFCFILLAIGWVELITPVTMSGYSAKMKPVFPFSEPSHYALTIGFLFCTFGYSSSRMTKILVIANMLAQAILFPNLTLLVFCFLSVFIFFGSKKITSVIAVGIVLSASSYFALSSFISSESIQYIISRLTISRESNNLTTLVFLQGIDDARRAFSETYGLGLGFQMAGTNSLGPYGIRIAALSGMNLNRFDGGFLASKLVSEFGIVGVIAVLFYIKKVMMSISVLRKVSSDDTEDSRVRIMWACAVISISVEIFIRGFGYFSPTLILFLSLYMMKKSRDSDRGKSYR